MQYTFSVNDFATPFKITIPPEEFENLRADHQFKKILRLARFVNQVAFCMSSVIGSDSKSISFNRQYANSLLFMSSVLFEGLKAYERLNSDFGHTKCYKAGYSAIFKNPDYSIVNAQLDRTRNKLTFHVDLDVYKETLKWVKFEEYVFINGSDGKVNNINFVLADDLAMNYLLGNHESDEDQLQFWNDYIDKLTKLVTLFLRHSNDLLHLYATDKGWPVSEISG